MVLGGISVYHCFDYLFTALSYPLFFYFCFGISALLTTFAITISGLMFVLPKLQKHWYIPLAIGSISALGFIINLLAYKSLYDPTGFISNVWGPLVVNLIIALAASTISLDFVDFKPAYIKPDPFYNYQNKTFVDDTPHEKVHTEFVEPTATRKTKVQTKAVDLTGETPVEQPTRKTRSQTRAMNIEEEVTITEASRKTKAQTKAVDLTDEAPIEQPTRKTRSQTKSYDIPQQEIHEEPEERPHINAQQIDPRILRDQIMANRMRAMQQQQKMMRGRSKQKALKVTAPKSEMEQLHIQLSKIKSMLDYGLITQEDYERLKAKILKL